MHYLELELESADQDQKIELKQKVWVEKIGSILWVHWKGRTFIYNPFYFSNSNHSNKNQTLDKKSKTFKEETKTFKKESKKRDQTGNRALDKEKIIEKNKNNQSQWIVSPVYGRVIKIHIKKGDLLKKGDPVLILESMKMEHMIKSNWNGKVSKIYVQKLMNIKKDEKLILVDVL